MFGRKKQVPEGVTTPTAGNCPAPRAGIIGADEFPWVDDVLVLEAEARKEPSPGEPSVVLEPALTVAALSVYGLPVLELD